MLFAVVTVCGVWLGYNVNWIYERRVGREWIDSHGYPSSIPDDWPKKAPWSLAVLGEQPLEGPYMVGARGDERTNLPAHRRQVASIRKLFPECQILDFDREDRTRPNLGN